MTVTTDWVIPVRTTFDRLCLLSTRPTTGAADRSTPATGNDLIQLDLDLLEKCQPANATTITPIAIQRAWPISEPETHQRRAAPTSGTVRPMRSVLRVLRNPDLPPSGSFPLWVTQSTLGAVGSMQTSRPGSKLSHYAHHGWRPCPEPTIQVTVRTANNTKEQS